MRKRPMIVARGLEARNHGPSQAAKQLDETVVLRFGVEHGQALAANGAWALDQHVVAQLRDIDGYQHGVGWRRLSIGHGRASPKCRFDTFTLEICGPALTACLSYDPPQALRASVEPVPDVLQRHRTHQSRGTG